MGVTIFKIQWIVLALLFATQAHAYSLIHPTPKDQMRPMVTDRPNVTNTPQTVDAGHLQVETGPISYIYYGRSSQGIAETSSLYIGAIQFKLGVLDWLDVEFGFIPYVRTTTTPVGGASTVTQGFGDSVGSFKVNLLGNDGGDWVVGLQPTIKFPTAQGGVGNGAYEGGGSVLTQYTLSERWSLSLDNYTAAVENSAGDGHTIQYDSSLSLSFDPILPLSLYLEFYSSVVQESGVPWVGQIDSGVVYTLSPNVVLDIAANFGITQAAPTVFTTVGVSRRF